MYVYICLNICRRISVSWICTVPCIHWSMLHAGCGSLMSGFLRRLFLQVLLEDERVLVCVTAKQSMYKGQSGSTVAGRLQHPKLGVGHSHRCLSMSVHSLCADVLAKVSGMSVLTVYITLTGYYASYTVGYVVQLWTSLWRYSVLVTSAHWLGRSAWW